MLLCLVFQTLDGQAEVARMGGRLPELAYVGLQSPVRSCQTL